MSSYQRGVILCRSGQRISRISNVSKWSLCNRRRCLSNEATTTQGSDGKAAAFDESVARLQRPRANPYPGTSKKLPIRKIEHFTKSLPDDLLAAGQEYRSPWVRVPFATKSRSYDPLFLRDSCTCPKCVDQSTRQKLFTTVDIPANIKVRTTWNEDNVLNLTWENDIPGFDGEHVTSIPHSFLRRSILKRPVKIYRTGKQMWSADRFAEHEITFDYNEYMSDDKVFFEALRQLQLYGLVFVKNVPEKEASVSDIATRIGPLKSTFYGSTWDVRSIAEAKNVAYTSQDLGFHMDLLYMHQPPRIQLLHCLKASTEGGTSLFSDAYAAAERLYKRDRPNFDILASLDVNFHYDNDSQHYHQSRRVLQFPPDVNLAEDDQRRSIHGLLEAVNWSPPFQGPFHNTVGDYSLAMHVRRWHRAASAFRELVEAKQAVYKRQMPPGECVIFDNRRVLHARTAFSGGERWLRGCYLDSDPLLSKMRVLEREFGNVTERREAEA